MRNESEGCKNAPLLLLEGRVEQGGARIRGKPKAAARALNPRA